MKALPQLGFLEAVKLASSRILDFKGRSRRSEFWWWIPIVLIANWVLSSFTDNLLLSGIISTVIMFFGLSATARRLQDADKSAWWVYISYALGIVSSVVAATSPAMNKLVENVSMGSLDEDAILKVWGGNAGEMIFYSGVSFLFGLSVLIVFIMCLKDSDPETTEHGDSPKYVDE